MNVSRPLTARGGMGWAEANPDRCDERRRHFMRGAAFPRDRLPVTAVVPDALLEKLIA